jgi:hypothetical protein
MSSRRSRPQYRPALRESRQVRRTALALVVVIAVMVPVMATIASGGGAGATPTDDLNATPGCENWCGNGSATVTIAGTTSNISGGGCYDRGAEGIDARFGDWQGVQGAANYLAFLAYRPGGATPTPAIAGATPQYPANPLSGSVGGSPFVLGPSSVITFNSDNTGTFSGIDVNEGTSVSGTFVCG